MPRTRTSAWFKTSTVPSPSRAEAGPGMNNLTYGSVHQQATHSEDIADRQTTHKRSWTPRHVSRRI